MRFPSRSVLLILAALLATPVTACAPAPPGRQILVTQWDTLLILGTQTPTDTSLVRPATILVSGELLFVLEDLDQQVRAFDTETGDRVWTFGRKGEGPGEMAFAYGLGIDPRGNLRIWDSRNRKLLEVDRSGRFLGEVYFRNLWGISGAPEVFGERLVWVQLAEGRPTFVSKLDGGEPVDSVRIQWPIPEHLPYRPNLFSRTAGSSNAWVMGLQLGPYFAVGTADGVHIHPFIEPPPFAYAANQRLSSRDPAADSARWGARDIGMTDTQILVLTGGRPPKLHYPEEPSRLIDVYGTDGVYQHSLLLPLDAHAFSTPDGETIFVLASPTTGLGVPQIFGLRPRT